MYQHNPINFRADTLMGKCTKEPFEGRHGGSLKSESFGVHLQESAGLSFGGPRSLSRSQMEEIHAQ